jgi:tRNA(Ile)-lysidine synthase TilS/MesJ
MKEGYQVFRPLIKYNNDDILKVITQENLPTLSIPCKFKDFRPKRILEKYYEKMGLRFDYNQLIDFAVKALNLPNISSFTSMEKEDYLGNVF